MSTARRPIHPHLTVKSMSDQTILTGETHRLIERRLLLDPGMDLTLRPMRYPHFYDRFRDAIKNTWTVEEVDLHTDLADLAKLSPAERHLVNRLVAFFATGDTIVANNLVLNLYQHVNAPRGAAVPVAAALRGGRARPVLPDPARHLRARRGRAGRGLRRRREHPVDPPQGRLLLPVDRLDQRLRSLETRSPTAARSCST